MKKLITALLAVSCIAFTEQPLRQASSFAEASADRQDRPNILLILADDLGYHDVGFHGSKRIKTPHLDRMAAEGCRFSDGHVAASVCSPSRAGLVTGRYQQRFGHEANCPPRPHGMDVNERTLGQALKDLGYRTALFGKWHLGDETHQHPTVRGFDEFWGLREGSRIYWFDKDHAHDKPGDPHNIEHNGKQVEYEGHLTDRLTDKAIEYMTQNPQLETLQPKTRNSSTPNSKPFFVFLSYTAPHAPLQSTQEDLNALGTDDHYAGLVYGMDRNIGRVFQTLETCAAKGGKSLLDNTMIWFLSDNGGTVKQASNVPLAAIKGTKFEGGHRVPFLLYWKDNVKAGQVYDPMVSALDIYPTCIKAAGGSLDQPRPVDGVDLIPYLSGKADGIPHEQLYWRKLECAAMRDGQWKLIRVDGLKDHLFDLSTDIGEYKDLAKQHPERLERMQKMLKAWEADKMQPLWDEAPKWTKVRYNDHKSWYEHGKLPRDMKK